MYAFKNKFNIKYTLLSLLTILLVSAAALIYAAANQGEVAENATQEQAVNIAVDASWTSENEYNLSGLHDIDAVNGAIDYRNATTVHFTTDDTVTAVFSAPVSRVYVIWNDVPSSWSITYGNNIVSCGENGFIHEYIELPEPTATLTFAIPANSTICDIRAYGSAGSLPDDVQTWSVPYERADMLLFSTHADDEHLFFGGIMPYYGGELGRKVQVAYMTDHSLTEKYRVHELLNGLWTVGIRAYPVFGGFRDEYAESLEQAMRIFDSEAVKEWQIATIRRFRPYVVVGHAFNGEYGHGAHMLNAHMLSEAVNEAADSTKHEQSYISYGAWDTPKVYLHLYEERTLYMDWANIKLSAFGGVTALDMAKTGYRCHISQQWMYFQVLTDGYGDCRCFGLYKTTVGDDVAKDDLFENIVFDPEPTPTIEPEPTPSITETAAPTDSPVTLSPSPTQPPASTANDDSSTRVIVIMLIAAIVILVLFLFLNNLRVRRARAQK